MTSPTSTAPDLTELAVRWLDALLDSASVDTIGVSNWWDRARAAMESAAAGADSLGHATSVAAKKLQITTLAERSSTTVANLGRELADPAVYHQWRDLITRDAVYLVALTRVHRQSRKATR